MKRLIRKIVLLIGDWAGLYLALFLLVVVRYQPLDWRMQWDIHFQPFSLVFFLWLIAIYGNFLYETRLLRFGLETIRAIGVAVGISVIASISAFYLFPPGLIHPRRNMVIFAAIYFLVLLLWRWLFYRITRWGLKTNLLFVGGGNEVEELNQHFKEHPHLGYKTKGIISNHSNAEEIKNAVESENVRLILVKSPERNPGFVRTVLPFLEKGIVIMDLEEFYERVFRKVSPEMLTDLWFIKNLEDINLEVYKFGKRASDIIIALLGILISLVFYPIVALAIKIDSPGPVILRQKRVGQNNKVFNLYKLRTMHVLSDDGSAEIEEARWAGKEDERITRVGNFLRKTRIDELPQLWNVLKGEMSFVGPRPERPEFVKDLEKHISYYNMRHLVKPGLTGWAQINYKYGDSIKDAEIKLQYDIYYAKKRSVALDLAIILKTLKIVATRAGQ